MDTGYSHPTQAPRKAKATHGLTKTDLLQLLNFLKEFLLQQFLLLLEFEYFLSFLLLHAFRVLRTWRGRGAGRVTQALFPSSPRDKGLRRQSCAQMLLLFLFSLFLNTMEGKQEAFASGHQKEPGKKMTFALGDSVILEGPTKCFVVQAHTRRNCIVS